MNEWSLITSPYGMSVSLLFSIVIKIEPKRLWNYTSLQTYSFYFYYCCIYQVNRLLTHPSRTGIIISKNIIIPTHICHPSAHIPESVAEEKQVPTLDTSIGEYPS